MGIQLYEYTKAIELYALNGCTVWCMHFNSKYLHINRSSSYQTVFVNNKHFRTYMEWQKSYNS